MPNLRTTAPAGAMLAFAFALTCPVGHAEEARYYFKISDVHAQDRKIIPMAKELLQKDVESRPELTSEPGEGGDEASRLAALKKRGIDAYLVSMRITSVKTEIKPPAPGKSDQQMAVEVKLSIFGHTLPGNKVMFNGDGESSLLGDFSERLRDKEEERFTKTALEGAIKQAVSTGIEKLMHASLDSGKIAKVKKGKGKSKR